MSEYIKHSAKGTTWGKHKYIAIRNGRYIYPEDVQGGKDSNDNERIMRDRQAAKRPSGKKARKAMDAGRKATEAYKKSDDYRFSQLTEQLEKVHDKHFFGRNETIDELWNIQRQTNKSSAEKDKMAEAVINKQMGKTLKKIENTQKKINNVKKVVSAPK